MKRYGNIYEKICDIDNIKLAIRKASKGKRQRRSVRRALNNIDETAESIKMLLETGSFKPSPYRQFTVRDNSSRKEREVFCPKFYPDQIVHWAIMLQIQPIMECGMYAHSCASRTGKGAHYGKRYIRKWLDNDRKNMKYCLKLDIRKFYPSVDHGALKETLRMKFKDEKLLDVLGVIIDSAEGLPIGNYTSQWFANFILTPLDHYIGTLEGVSHRMRYMDDIVVFSNSKKKLHEVRKQIELFIKPLKLELKGNWQVFKVKSRGIDFLGFRFFFDKTILRRRTALRMRRAVKRAYKSPHPTYRQCAGVLSRIGLLKHTDTYYFSVKYIKPYLKIKKIQGGHS